MAETTTTLDKVGLTRGKAVLIAALAVALLVVIYIQYGAEEVSDVARPRSRARRLPAAAQNAATAEIESLAAGEQPDEELQQAMAEMEHSRWQSPDLAEVIVYDPFALPASFPQPAAALLDSGVAAKGVDLSGAAARAQRLAEAVERLQQQLQELQQRGVHVIVNRHDEYVAMVGERTLRVGDEINGFTVTAIDPSGVRVERKDVE